MNTTAGLWIDHRKPVVAIVSAKGEETMEIKSNVDKQPGRFAGIRSTAPTNHSWSRPTIGWRGTTGHLNQYYAKVIASISNADAILVFGPGEAKSELKKRLDRAKFGGHITVMETTDKLTDRQIAAKALKYFHKANSLRSSNGAASAAGRKLRRNTPARKV